MQHHVYNKLGVPHIHVYVHNKCFHMLISLRLCLLIATIYNYEFVLVLNEGGINSSLFVTLYSFYLDHLWSVRNHTVLFHKI